MNDSVIEQAAAWYARHRVGPLSDADATAFRGWLKAAPEHAREWNRLEELWASLDSVRDAPRLMNLREAVRAQAGQRRARRLAWQWGGALAASLLLAAVVWRSPVPDVVRADASSALLTPAVRPLRSVPLVRDVATHLGERALVELADGSLVTLNTDSAIHADFTGGARRITLLRGEAYFEVAKDRVHPFVVAAGGREVIAVGTAFGIRLQSEELKVDLVEGKVRVLQTATGASAVELDAGSSLLARTNAADVIGPFNAEHDIGWRNGRLVFDSERLAEVVVEVNRYSTQKLALQDAGIAEQRVSGVFDPANAGNLAKVLEGYGMVRIASWNNSEILLAAP